MTHITHIIKFFSKVIAFAVVVFIIFAPFWGTNPNAQALTAAESAANIAYQQCMSLPGASSSNCINSAVDQAGVKPTSDVISGTKPPTEVNTNGAVNGSTGNKNPPKSDELGCGIGTSFDAAVCLSSVVYAFTVGLGSGLAYVGGFIFDITVALSLNSAAYALDFLSGGWTLARDLANMAFILILVYIAFTIMFQAETARTMQMLALVIFIALIINFSFFLTRVVIDVGNILAVQFYNAIDAPTMQQTFNNTGSKTGALANTAASVTNYITPQGVFANTKDLTASIMAALNIQQLFSDQNFKAFAANSSLGTKFIILTFLYIGIGACYFILAAIFFAVGIKFLVRIVILWLLIVASPLAFVAKAIPGRGDVSAWYDTWQENLVSHAFYPAFFLFIFLFISTVMKGISGPTGIVSSLAADLNKLGSNPDGGGIIFIASALANVGIRLGFVVALLYAALKASEFMGVRGANMAHKVTSFAFGQTGRLASAPVGWVGRQTFGRAGNKMADTSKKFENRALLASNVFTRTGWKGLQAVTGVPGERLGKANYDPRNAPGASILKKGVEKITGGPVNAGKPPEGGFAAQAKDRAERIKKERALRTKLLKEAETREFMSEFIEKIQRHETLETTARSGGALTHDQALERRALKIEIEKMANKFNGLNKEEIDNLKLADVEKVLKHSKESVIKKIEESEKHSDKDKAGMRAKWEDSSVEHAQNIIKNLEQIRKDLTTRGLVPAASLNVLKASTQAGALIDDEQIKDLLKELKKEIPAARQRMTAAATEADRNRERENIQVLQEARDYVSKMDVIRKGIPDGKGGTFRAGEFVVA